MATFPKMHPLKFFCFFTICWLFSCLAAFAQDDYTATLMGFTQEHSRQQRLLENQFDSMLHASEMDTWMQRLSAHPHHVGSPYDAENVKFLEAQFQSWGFDTRIDTYYVLFPTPKTRQLDLISPTSYTSILQEKVLKEDAYTAQTKEQLPPYNIYSADGDVTADLVFVNYGIPDDYDRLAEMGVSVKGKIVITKYGGSWRGIKPKVAFEHGAIGCIIYSDPQTDGYYQGDTYPRGAYKNPYGVQRGSVMDMPVYAGDPLTPGYAATKNAKRLRLQEATTIMKIPVLPISYHDAQPLLAALGGPVAPAEWRGALPITYHVGPGPAKVHLKLLFNWDIKPVRDVIATIRGSAYPDQWVIRGNHQDAWVNGAADPVSGLVAEMGEAQAIGRLVKQGWRPKRTLVYCAWDGEEPGLLGSTEFVEDHGAELQEKAVAYINSDNNGRGFLYAGGSHTLEKFFTQVAFDVIDPETGISVGQRSLDAGTLRAGKTAHDFHIGALGSGSDYSPFLQHLGIASMNLGFGGEDGGGEYHTMYDTYTLFKKFKDPDLAYEVALAQVAGRTVLRLAEADILPFEFQHFYGTVQKYTGELQQLADHKRAHADFQHSLIRGGIYEKTEDPTHTFVVPPPETEVPYFNFAPLQNAMARLHHAADTYQGWLQQLPENPDSNTIRVLNSKIYKSERYLTAPDGLPGRPWYRHLVYAPGLYTGYGVKTLPGIREAIEEGDYNQVDPQMKRVSRALDQFSDFIDGLIPEK